jgi:short chain dehydrogenase
VAICARRKQPLEAAASQIARETNRKIVAIPADLTKPADAEAFVKDAHTALGCIDILVNNSGSAPGGVLDFLIKLRTDRFYIAQAGGGYNGHLRRRVHRQNAASRDRASDKAQDAGTPRLISGVTAAPLQQNRVFIARQWPPDPSHFEDAWSKVSSGSCAARRSSASPGWAENRAGFISDEQHHFCSR